MRSNGWPVALAVGAGAAVGVAVLGVAYVLVTGRPVHGGDGSLARSVVLVALGTFLGGTLGVRISHMIRQRQGPDGG